MSPEYFSLWALVVHLGYLVRLCPNTFLLSLLVLVGAEAVRLCINRDDRFIDPKTRRYRDYWDCKMDIWIHWVPVVCTYVIGVYRNDGMNVPVLIIPLLFYFAYMNFSTQNILRAYQYPLGPKDLGKSQPLAFVP